jgi:hypothetical protein
MQSRPFLESASVIRRVRTEFMRTEQKHLDVREITDTVYEQVSPLHALCEQAEHGVPKIGSWRRGLG